MFWIVYQRWAGMEQIDAIFMDADKAQAYIDSREIDEFQASYRSSAVNEGAL